MLLVLLIPLLFISNPLLFVPFPKIDKVEDLSLLSELFCLGNKVLFIFLNVIITTVTLSSVFLSNDSLISASTHVPDYLWISSYLLSLVFYQITLTASSELTRSNIPSLPKIIKSLYSVIFICLISGSAITTFGFPPYFVNLASLSPIVLLTDNFPGKTLKGVTIFIPANVKLLGILAILV